MNTWFCNLLSLICLSILSSENLYGHEQSLKITMKRNVNQTELVKIYDHCYPEDFRCTEAASYWGLCSFLWLGPWDLSSSSLSASHWRQFESQSQLPVPTSRVTGTSYRGPGAHIRDWGEQEEPLPTLGCHYNPCSLCPLPDTITTAWIYQESY